ncbi:MAG: ArsR/SmtB family transcription factor [Luteolibacter sp.]
MPRAKLEGFDDSLVMLARFARALSHPARIRILRLLALRGELPGMALVAELPLSQPTCSRHLNLLLEEGLLRSRQSGNQFFFQLDTAVLREFCESMSHLLHPEDRQIVDELAYVE